VKTKPTVLIGQLSPNNWSLTLGAFTAEPVDLEAFLFYDSSMAGHSKSWTIRLLLLAFCIAVLLGIYYAGVIWWVYYKGSDQRPVPPEADVEITQLHDGFFMLQGGGGNITVSTGPDGMLIVDTDEKSRLPKIQAALNSLEAGPLRYVINTHAHEDHRGGNGAFRGAGADIIAHEAAKKDIEAYSLSLDPPTPDEVPNVSVIDGHTFEFNGQRVTLYHSPLAHTDGDLIIHFQQANIIATGDVFINMGLPYLSRKRGATLDGHLDGQTMILGMADKETVLIPGHGNLSDITELAEIQGTLEQIQTYMRRLKTWGVPSKVLPLFHPIHAWPKERRTGHGWEKYWSWLVYVSLP
jgi:glyoxylase-like metal-dependent hydrolase (beta-lactamase superfamily II)